MIIQNAARLDDWCAEHAEKCGALAGLTPRVADHCVSSLGAVLWRHARGMGLEPGADWSILLEMYGPEEIAKVVKEAIKTAGRSR